MVREVIDEVTESDPSIAGRLAWLAARLTIPKTAAAATISTAAKTIRHGLARADLVILCNITAP